jgi:hypothetical protein
MKNFNEFWKNKAENKNISASDMVAYHILRTIAAKSESKEEVLKYYLGRAFTPALPSAHRKHPFQALHDAAWLVEVWLRNRQEIMGQPLLNFLETNEEIELFSKLLEVAKNYGKVK